jgi:hypothetical protein
MIDEPRREMKAEPPLKKFHRPHVIEAIHTTSSMAVRPQLQKQPKREEYAYSEPEQKFVPVIQEEESIIPETETDEEMAVPVKISSSTREPEDSFYKVSSKGLRYVEEPEGEVRVVPQPPKVKAARTPKESASQAGSIAMLLSTVVVAGVLSLGVFTLLAYYLHSYTAVDASGQTSSLQLSQ